MKPNHLKPLRRGDVYAALNIKGETIPPDMAGTFPVNIVPDPVLWGYRAYHGDLIVKAATGAYAKHRIFVPCSCGRLIPFGRIAQHDRACKAGSPEAAGPRGERSVMNATQKRQAAEARAARELLAVCRTFLQEIAPMFGEGRVIVRTDEPTRWARVEIVRRIDGFLADVTEGREPKPE